MTRFPNRQIATGWDNEAGFAVVESISVSGTSLQLEDVIKGMSLDANTHFVVRGGIPLVNRVATTAGSSQNGYEVIAWILPVVSGNALQHWIDTYVGKVTIATSRLIYDTYENWNAIGGYPQYSDAERRYYAGHWWYFNVRIDMKLVSTT